MAIRVILMPLDRASAKRSELSAGITTAHLLSAHLGAVFVRADPTDAFAAHGFEPSDDDESTRMMCDRIDKQGRADAERCRRKFSELCQKADLPKIRESYEAEGASASWRTFVGDAQELIPAAAQGADLSLFTGSSARYNPVFENLLEITLLRSGRPVLFVPEGCEVKHFRSPLIAWDGASACARAVSAWVDLAATSDTAIVLHVEEQNGEAPLMSEVVRHLGWHRISARVETVRRGFDSVGQAVIKAADAYRSGVIVMGGYGRARYREALFGGVTRYVLRHARVPVLMVH